MSASRVLKHLLCLATHKDHVLTDVYYYASDFHLGDEHSQTFIHAKQHFKLCNADEQKAVIDEMKHKNSGYLQEIAKLFNEICEKSGRRHGVRNKFDELFIKVEKVIAINNFLKQIGEQLEDDIRLTAAINLLEINNKKIVHPKKTSPNNLYCIDHVSISLSPFISEVNSTSSPLDDANEYEMRPLLGN